MIRILLDIAAYWRKPTLKEWRRIRVLLMARLPKSEKAGDVELTGP